MDKRQTLINSITDIEQRIFIKFCVLLSYSNSVIAELLTKSIGPKAYPQKTVEKWTKMFRDGRTSADDQRGKASKINEDRYERIKSVESVLEETRHTSVRMISHRTGIPKTTVHAILRDDLGLRKRLGRYVPHDLTPDNKDHRILACSWNLAEYKKHNGNLKRTLAIDETWVGLYMEPQRDQARAWLEPNVPGPSIPKQPLHGPKRMLLLAMDYYGIAFWHLFPVGVTVNSDRYIETLNEYIPKWLVGKPFKSPMLLHDNARPHKAQPVIRFLRDHQINEWKHPPYSPDAMPPDFDCFGPLKRELRGKKYSNWDDFERGLGDALTDLQNRGFFKGVQKLPQRWQRIVDNEGEYI